MTKILQLFAIIMLLPGYLYADELYTAPMVKCVPDAGFFEVTKLSIYNQSPPYPKELGVPIDYYKNVNNCVLSDQVNIKYSHKYLEVFQNNESILKTRNPFSIIRIFTQRMLGYDKHLVSAEVCILRSNLATTNKQLLKTSGCVYRGIPHRFSFDYANVIQHLEERAKP